MLLTVMKWGSLSCSKFHVFISVVYKTYREAIQYSVVLAYLGHQTPVLWQISSVGIGVKCRWYPKVESSYHQEKLYGMEFAELSDFVQDRVELDGMLKVNLMLMGAPKHCLETHFSSLPKCSVLCTLRHLTIKWSNSVDCKSDAWTHMK